MSKNQIKKTRPDLYRHIYNECRKKVSVTGHGTSHEDATRFIRESAIKAVTERSRVDPISDYKDCTDEELVLVFNYLTLCVLPQKVFPLQEWMSVAQSKKLQTTALECALTFCPFESVTQFTDEATGEILWGEAARARAVMLFRHNALSGSIMKHLYTQWINPKIHQFLHDAKLRYDVRMPTAMYYVDWKTITREEADALIKRFNKMLNEVIERGYQKVEANQFELYNN